MNPHQDIRFSHKKHPKEITTNPNQTHGTQKIKHANQNQDQKRSHSNQPILEEITSLHGKN